MVYCIPAGWVWGDHGFLKQLGAVDIAGSGPVHLIGKDKKCIMKIAYAKFSRGDEKDFPHRYLTFIHAFRHTWI